MALQPSLRQIQSSIHKMDVPTLVMLYNQIQDKTCRLPKRQRDLVVKKVTEYERLGIVKFQMQTNEKEGNTV